jgi:hypothetical protein
MPDVGFLVVRRQGFELPDPLIKSQPLRAATDWCTWRVVGFAERLVG